MATSGRAAVWTLALACLSASVFAADLEEAKALLEEGKAMLKKARGTGGDAIRGSHEAIEKLREAAGLLADARAGSREADLLEDINSLIFWARRTTPLDVRSLIGSSKGSSTGRPSSTATTSAPESRPPEAGPSDPAEAAAALAKAEGHARSHPDDHLTCAARFFEIADRYKDIHDVAFKAISRAQEFQRLAEERKALREAEAKFAALPRDEQLVVEGDRAFAEKSFEKAAIKYGQAIAVKKTAGRHRKLGHALFGRAQELRVEYTKAYLEGRKKFLRAKSRGDRRGMKRALAENRRASQISKNAILHYGRAEAAFRAAWNASDRLDLDSELHMALTFIVRREARYVMRAKAILERILLNYHDRLATDEERTLYACAETYAGPAIVSQARWKIARSAEASVGEVLRGREAGEGGEEDVGETGALMREVPPRKMSDDDLREALAGARADLKMDEHRLHAYQATGRFDKKLLDEVNAGRERVKELAREAERRGIR